MKPLFCLFCSLFFSFFISGVQAQTTTINSAVEPAEVNQLVNIAISLTPFASRSNYTLTQNSEYNQKVHAWFDKYKDYRVIKDFDELLQKDTSAYSELKTYSTAYQFKRGKLVKNVDLMPDPSKLDQFIPQLEVFAISTGFRKFYRKNHKAISAIPQSSFQTINIMDDFWKFWEQGETADLSTRTRLFREIVINPHKEIFAGFTGNLTDEDFASYIKAMPKFIPKLRKITQKLDGELPAQIARFKETFPDMNWNGTVVFMPNFGQTDSGGGSINDKSYQIFGVDTIAFDYGEDADLAVLFSHELFHLYFGQFSSRTRKKS